MIYYFVSVHGALYATMRRRTLNNGKDLLNNV